MRCCCAPETSATANASWRGRAKEGDMSKTTMNLDVRSKTLVVTYP